MKHALLHLTAALLIPGAHAVAADLKPDATTEIPESAKRPVVVSLTPSQIAALKAQMPKATLPEDLALQVIAAPPLVTHPLMGCFDDRGRLFVGDAVGVNWNKKQLEANPPNRVLMLEDTDGDGIFDKSTVFADHMTFPQGGCWLKGSLYVCSPPGVWKLTDTKGAGVADQRELIVSGFDYSGNAADVHGPWLHPNGRLYWCHGRKGHKVIGKEGVVVHEGLASGIWSCKPDGSDVQWHALGCMDNPVKIDFTPTGDILGVVNLYYNQPRGDCLIHWLYGGAYERADQIQAIAALPRTLEHMPVVHNFGHVAVSGCCLYPSGALNAAWRNNLFVTHFNTQKVVRVELAEQGATYSATEHDFLKLDDPDAHFTDVFPDAKGNLVVLNTGGWFRIGCPSSLMAKPDVLGAIYQVTSRKAPAPPTLTKVVIGGLPLTGTNALVPGSLTFSGGVELAPPAWELKDENQVLAFLRGESAKGRLAACEWVARHKPANPAIRAAILELLGKPCDPALEHQVMFAVLALGGVSPVVVDQPLQDVFGSRELIIGAQDKSGAGQFLVAAGALSVGPQYPLLTKAVIWAASSLTNGSEILSPNFTEWLTKGTLSAEQLQVLAEVTSAHLAQPQAQAVLTSMLAHASAVVRQEAWKVLAHQTASVTNEAWLAPLDKSLATAHPAELALLLDCIVKLKTHHFDAILQTVIGNEKLPQSVRLKALSAAARSGKPLDDAGFALLLKLLNDTANITARIEAARVCGTVSLSKEQILALAPVLPAVGPLELHDLIKIVHKTKDPEVIKACATQIAKSPVIGGIEESVFKTLFASSLPEAYEIVAPAIRAAEAANELKKRKLESLAAEVSTRGRPEEGRKIYESGRGTCIACHQIGDKGRAIGPNLSHIGQIRLERDIMESILFPSNTLARDYEAHAIETSDGQTLVGIIKSHTAEGLLMVDVAGQEKNIPHSSIVANTMLTTSLMPMGLDQTLSEQELTDLVAWLRSLK